MSKGVIKNLEVRTRRAWRNWLSKHNASESEIWLVFNKRSTGLPSLDYEDAVEEALCFGWIDSIIKRIDDVRYVRKFTPRKADSKWSTVNRKRYTSLKRRGLLAQPGLRRAPTSQSYDSTPTRATSTPAYIEKAFRSDRRAWQYFEKLAPSYRRAYIGWIDSAKREETEARRLAEALRVLAAGKKLGLK